MKKTIFGIFFLILLSCSKDDEVIKDDTIINLEVQIAINKPEVYVLEHTDFKFTFNRAVNSQASILFRYHEQWAVVP